MSGEHPLERLERIFALQKQAIAAQPVSSLAQRIDQLERVTPMLRKHREAILGALGDDLDLALLIRKAVLDGVRDVTDAERLAESVHAAVAVDLDVDGAVVRPGISIGVTLAEQGQDIDEVLRDADTALYAAKRGGRDRVVTFERGMTPFGA